MSASQVCDVPEYELTPQFAAGWNAARQHLQAAGRGGLSWLQATLDRPMAEHLSFRLGNQVFFVWIEIAGVCDLDAQRLGVLKQAADRANAHCCVLPLRRGGEQFRPVVLGWGLLDAGSRRPVDPPSLVSREPVVMTDWEVHDFAIEIVRQHLAERKLPPTRWQSNLGIDPSLWFDGPRGPEYVVVRGARYPLREAGRPAHVDAIRRNCAGLSLLGNFASVAIASADDPFNPDGSHAKPLLRGHPTVWRLDGLVPL